MGASNSCTCSDDKKYRFKGFIVSVYPDDKHGGPNEDALGKLNSYVDSNPERIPRVCRKITKILHRHLNENKEDRVMVSLLMLRSLMEHSKNVDGFVPHSIDICALLLSTNVTRYHVGAADVLSVMCYRLSTLPNTDTSRRLIADNKDRLVPQLLKMTSDHIASRKDVKGMQTRYAAILALGNIANCIHTALAGGVGGIMQAMIVNLILVLRERAQKPLSDASVRLLADRHYGGAAAVPTECPTLELPAKTEDQDVVYALACSHGIGATAACTTTAGVGDLLSCVTGLLDKQNGWVVPYVPSLVFSDILSAMQHRPQQLGFSVYQCLCEVGERNTDPNVRIGVLRALQACMDALPMTGGRPAVVLNYLLSVMQLPIASTTASAGGTDTDAETARILKDTHDVVVRLTARLLRATYRQRNAPQLQNILVSLWNLLRSAQAESSPSPTLTLRLLIVAAPYIRAVPLVDRKVMQVTQTLDAYLNGSDDALRHLAARVLTGVLAGLPEARFSRTDAAAGNANTTTAASSPPRAPLLPSKNGTLCTDEQDVAYAQEWVKSIVKVTDGITPRCVVAVADVLCALMAGYGMSGLPFNLTFLWTLQQRCVRAEAGNALGNSPSNRPTPQAEDQTPGSSAAPQDDTASSIGTSAVTTTMLASRSATSQLTRAWLHMVAAALVTTGNIYGIPNLVTYGMEVLNRRSPLGQLATCFEPALRAPERAIDVYTVSGLRYLASEKSRPLPAELTEPPVSKLPSFSYVANIIVDADLPDASAVFGGNAEEELHTIIEDVCFRPESEANVSLSSALAARDTSVAAATAVTQSSRFSLAVNDAAKVAALRSLRVSVVDNCIPRTQDSKGALALSEAATTTEKKVQEIVQLYNVDAATQVLPPEMTASLPPLPMLPSPSNDDTTAGASESSGAPFSGHGQLTPSQAYGSVEGTPGVNPIDIDVGIRASRKSQHLLSANTLPAGRYVSLE
jgi:protein EFR3